MPKDKNWWAIIRSMKMGLYLALAISITSMVGTIVPQQQIDRSANWLEQFLQLNDLYHSWWYIALLSLLTLNLMACSFYRIKTIKAALKKSEHLLEIEELEKLKNHTTFVLTGELDEVKNKITSLLAGHRYEVWSDSSADRLRIGAQYGRFSVLGSFITHISFVIIMAGILTGVILGWQGTVNVPVGTTFNLSDVNGTNVNAMKHNLQVKVDRFWIDRYSNGTPSAYYSRLTIIENHKNVQTSVVAVNSPLNYKGIKFYQARYGDAIEIRVNGPDGRKISGGLVGEGDRLTIPKTNLSVLVYKYITDSEAASAMTANSHSINPRVVYVIYKGNQRIGMGIGEFGSTINLDGQGHTLKFVRTILYTGLQVKKDPGVSLIWFGSGFMLLGMGLSFFLQPRYLWLVLEQQGKLVTVSMGGKANKNHLSLADHINKIARDIQGYPN
ncbi:MAG TPA: cytochrome c biogenesis protein ResB [Syntrophomonadaceae bacterium]|nr:cytochrome c biogenesis protein ResB [Syntrophomonadaceae bacterium]